MKLKSRKWSISEKPSSNDKINVKGYVEITSRPFIM